MNISDISRPAMKWKDTITLCGEAYVTQIVPVEDRWK